MMMRKERRGPTVDSEALSSLSQTGTQGHRDTELGSIIESNQAILFTCILEVVCRKHVGIGGMLIIRR